MLIDVKPILHTPGGERTFQFELDLSDMEFAGRYPISRPVIVEGVVRNRAELLSLELTAYTTLDAVCDRCGKKFTQEKAVSYSCILAEELQNEDSDEIVLCSEDCKGLCPRCGADLNLGPCSCKKEVDPRLAVLAKLLENK